MVLDALHGRSDFKRRLNGRRVYTLTRGEKVGLRPSQHVQLSANETTSITQEPVGICLRF